MAVWPASLPQTLLQAGYREAMPSNAIQTQMDAGPPKARRRYTAGWAPISAMSNMSTTQIADFKTFYKTTLLSGTQPFDWTDPIAGGTVSLRFDTSKPPNWAPLSGRYYKVSMDLWILP